MEPEHENQPKPELVRSLMDLSLAKDAYEADLAVTDRYQQFSAEILRLSLAGIGVFGFILKDVVLNKDNLGNYALPFSQASWCFAMGLLFLGLSAGLALAHRYFASDCISYQIAYLRAKLARDALLKDKPANSADIAKHNQRMADEKAGLGRLFKLCASILAFAATFLGIGIGLIALGAAWTLF